MIWPFSRKPKPLNPGPINEDWAVGDLAECIPSDLAWEEGEGPEAGDILTVTFVEAGRHLDGTDGWYLSFALFREAFNANEFRKVPPLNSKASAEFTAQIKALQPKERARRMAATARRAA